MVVGFPFAAFAVTGSNVFVTDATSGSRAKVDSGAASATGSVSLGYIRRGSPASVRSRRPC